MSMMIDSQLLAEPLAKPPDLTQSNTVDRTLTYNLGPTGLRGWIFDKAASYGDGVQGRTTTESRQILVTHVGANSPASGVIMKEIVQYGTAARGVIPELKALIVQYNTTYSNNGFPGELNKQRVASVAEAIKSIESATTQPELRSIVPTRQ